LPSLHPRARVAGASVTFEPAARTAWHTHPLGQTLIVTAGCGWAQRWGGPREEIRPGDVIWIPPGEKHWHGAAATTAMTHIAIQEKLDGRAVDWLEKVSDRRLGDRMSAAPAHPQNAVRKRSPNTASTSSSGALEGLAINCTSGVS
jgi:quercetin dioxygenase-like cupin family protein